MAQLVRRQALRLVASAPLGLRMASYRQYATTPSNRAVSKASSNTAMYAAVLATGAVGLLTLTQGSTGGSKPIKKVDSAPAPKPVEEAPRSSNKTAVDGDDEDWGAWLLEMETEEKNGGVAASAVDKSPAVAKAAPTQSSKPAQTAPVEPKREPKHYRAQYVLVGAGTAAHSAMDAILEKDPKARILIIGEEADVPYMRPPLSKELWFVENSKPGQLSFKDWNGEERDVYLQPATKYVSADKLTDGSVGILSGSKATELDARSKKITLANGDTVEYNKLLLATGGRPRNLPVFAYAPSAVREKIDDYRKLDELTRNKKVKTLVVVGGGFLGSEMAVALGNRSKKTGMKVVQVFPEPGNMGAVFPKYLSEWTAERVKDEGVDVRATISVEKVRASESGQVRLTLSDGSTLDADHVVLAVGLEPNVDLAKQAGLETDTYEGGIMVNSELQALSDVFAAGDCASFFDPHLGRRRVEHHDHAVVSGKLAGENMADPKTRAAYKHQSMFWGDLGSKIGYEAVGLVDASLQTVGVWNTSDSRAESDPDQFNKGVVFYLRDDVVVGVLLWNVFNKIAIARKVIRDAKPVKDTKELARLFDVHE